MSEPAPGADDSWQVMRRLRYSRTQRIVAGLPQFGFHTGGRLFAVEFGAGWVAQVEPGRVAWTAGLRDPGLASVHVTAPFDRPRFVAMQSPGSILVTDANGVHRVDLGTLGLTPLLRACDLGIEDPGNCVVAPDGRLWLSDITGHQVLELDAGGRLARRIGDGNAGFQTGTVSAAKARFGWIYDLRCGPDGRLYVLDSTNYAVRVLDPRTDTVTTICGDGTPGADGDGGPAVQARLGGDPAVDFDGPWSLVVAANGDVYVGDTYNHAVRRISAVTGRIGTIAAADSPSPAVEGVSTGAGAPTAMFTRICGMDLDSSGELLVPDWVDDEFDELIVLRQVRRELTRALPD